MFTDAAAHASSVQPSATSLVQRLARGVRSGLRRYPREIASSLSLHNLSRGLSGSDLPARVVPGAHTGSQQPEPHAPQAHGPAELIVANDHRDPAQPQAPMAALWIGHATVLVRIGTQTILTDPVFSERIGVSLPMPALLPHAKSGVLAPSPRRALTLGLSRFAPPSLAIEQLPKIDLILLSHAHFDHLDRPSLQRLAAGPAASATVVTAGNTSRLIPRASSAARVGFTRILELGWGQSLDLGALHVEALRPAHWGARTAFDHHRKWNAYLVTGPSRTAQRFFFAGDTAFTSAFDRVNDVTLAAFGIGAYDPWHDAHATPEQAWRMFAAMRASRLLPMHHSTFPLSDEPIDEPLARLRRVACRDTDRLVCQAAGDVWRA